VIDFQSIDPMYNWGEGVNSCKLQRVLIASMFPKSKTMNSCSQLVFIEMTRMVHATKSKGKWIIQVVKEASFDDWLWARFTIINLCCNFVFLDLWDTNFKEIFFLANKNLLFDQTKLGESCFQFHFDSYSIEFFIVTGFVSLYFVQLR